MKQLNSQTRKAPGAKAQGVKISRLKPRNSEAFSPPPAEFKQNKAALPVVIKVLNVKQRQYLKGLAHHLSPVVMLSDKGLTDAVMKEIELNLSAHELIKVRVFGDDRDLRKEFASIICSKTEAQLVQSIGKLIVLYRPSANRKIVVPNI